MEVSPSRFQRQYAASRGDPQTVSPFGNPVHYPDTVKRASHAAGPMREAVRKQVTSIHTRLAELHQLDNDAIKAVEATDVQLNEAKASIEAEFEAMRNALQEAMLMRSQEMQEAANSHFMSAASEVDAQRELIAQEYSTLAAMAAEGERVLELDDAWFVQAHPDTSKLDITKYPPKIQHISIPRWSCDFNSDSTLIADMVTAVRTHGVSKAWKRESPLLNNYNTSYDQQSLIPPAQPQQPEDAPAAVAPAESTGGKPSMLGRFVRVFTG